MKRSGWVRRDGTSYKMTHRGPVALSGRDGEIERFSPSALRRNPSAAASGEPLRRSRRSGSSPAPPSPDHPPPSALRLFRMLCRLHQNSTGAIHQFSLVGLKSTIKFYTFSHANHGGGAQHVQHHLLQSALRRVEPVNTSVPSPPRWLRRRSIMRRADCRQGRSSWPRLPSHTEH